ncbi:uncharacterized protein LOC131370635 isoform X2 [Hemibagrus wyckioides]|uniref:uncharacterized protein LOC131370635 isoform X2 n=1 Tax=Hemibagrus wyckioides TaxID=337641 RepID=UPI00266BC41C|nr:uncharacterized protein LOC131370635 isoform X2 [Hemibagrus wyckioides]
MGEQPIFSTQAHMFQIEPATKCNWIPASKHAVTVSFFYDANRHAYRIISVGGTKIDGSLKTWRKLTQTQAEDTKLHTDGNLRSGLNSEAVVCHQDALSAFTEINIQLRTASWLEMGHL